jgi:Transposase DNA-binding
MGRKASAAVALSAEFDEVDLGDARLNRRLLKLADSVADRPGESFPKALDDAELEAAYRFFGNDQVTPEAILAPHVRQSARRAADLDRVLVVHDTTAFEFGGQTKRDGLGHLIKPSAQGFFGHFSLALASDGSRHPVGLLGLETVFRLKKRIGHKRWSRDKRLGESDRWLRGVEAAEEALGRTGKAIHITDREGDQYALIANLVDGNRAFVIRSFQDRRLSGEDQVRLRAVATAAKVTVRREVPLSPRPKINGPKGDRHPARRHRVARLTFAATTVEIARTLDAPEHAAATIVLNVIHVAERRPPAGQAPVEWFLLTNLPIHDEEAILFAVDCYRARWAIEEYFKALKTGCQYERRQLESAHSLLNALAVLAPVAWRLLLLRHLARAKPTAPASTALTQKQLEVLRAVSKKPLRARASAREAMLAVAALGGHIKTNGDPGWLVVGRGMHDLLLLELGWRAREQAEK